MLEVDTPRVLRERYTKRGQSQQRESPGAGRLKRLRGWRCFGEQTRSPTSPRWVDVVACTLPQRPERPAMAILRASVFEPATLETQEVAKPPGNRVPGILDKGGKNRRERLVQALLAECVQGACQQQSTCIVINAVAVGPVRHAVNRMLEKARVIAH